MIARHRQGLRTLSTALIKRASDDTVAQVTRIGLTFLCTAAFCLLSLFSPDTALLGVSSEKINVPFAGPVSFFGLMLLGPAFLIVLRVYLQIYFEHSERLERIARRMHVERAPTLVPFKNPLIRVFSGLTFYLLLPMAMLLFALKAAVFPAWGSGLLCVTAGVIASHAMLPLRRLSWRSRALLSLGAAILVGGILAGRPLRRPFFLFRANLSGQYLFEIDLTGAMLRTANLNGAVLAKANLAGADMIAANLSGANLSGTDLRAAKNSIAGAVGQGMRHRFEAAGRPEPPKSVLGQVGARHRTGRIARLTAQNMNRVGAEIEPLRIEAMRPALRSAFRMVRGHCQLNQPWSRLG